MKTNTMICINLKIRLQSDVLMKPEKNYLGILRRDIPSDEFGFDDSHYTFTETIPQNAGKRNPHVFDGKYITVTRRDDGRLRPNFKNLEVGADFKIETYAQSVYNELCMALAGLVEGN